MYVSVAYFQQGTTTYTVSKKLPDGSSFDFNNPDPGRSALLQAAGEDKILSAAEAAQAGYALFVNRHSLDQSIVDVGTPRSFTEVGVDSIDFNEEATLVDSVITPGYTNWPSFSKGHRTDSFDVGNARFTDGTVSDRVIDTEQVEDNSQNREYVPPPGLPPETLPILGINASPSVTPLSAPIAEAPVVVAEPSVTSGSPPAETVIEATTEGTVS